VRDLDIRLNCSIADLVFSPQLTFLGTPQVAKYVPASALQIALLIVEKRSWTKPSHDPTGSGKERELLLDNQIRERPAFYCYNGPTPKRGEGNGSPLRHY
jgi:hypothetical protein